MLQASKQCDRRLFQQERLRTEKAAGAESSCCSGWMSVDIDKWAVQRPSRLALRYDGSQKRPSIRSTRRGCRRDSTRAPSPGPSRRGSALLSAAACLEHPSPHETHTSEYLVRISATDQLLRKRLDATRRSGAACAHVSGWFFCGREGAAARLALRAMESSAVTISSCVSRSARTAAAARLSVRRTAACRCGGKVALTKGAFVRSFADADEGSHRRKQGPRAAVCEGKV